MSKTERARNLAAVTALPGGAIVWTGLAFEAAANPATSMVVVWGFLFTAMLLVVAAAVLATTLSALEAFLDAVKRDATKHYADLLKAEVQLLHLEQAMRGKVRRAEKGN